MSEPIHRAKRGKSEKQLCETQVCVWLCVVVRVSVCVEVMVGVVVVVVVVLEC